jgi:hypothetical protein
MIQCSMAGGVSIRGLVLRIDSHPSVEVVERDGISHEKLGAFYKPKPSISPVQFSSAY